MLPRPSRNQHDPVSQVLCLLPFLWLDRLPLSHRHRRIPTLSSRHMRLRLREHRPLLSHIRTAFMSRLLSEPTGSITLPPPIRLLLHRRYRYSRLHRIMDICHLLIRRRPRRLHVQPSMVITPHNLIYRSSHTQESIPSLAVLSVLNPTYPRHHRFHRPMLRLIIRISCSIPRPVRTLVHVPHSPSTVTPEPWEACLP